MTGIKNQQMPENNAKKMKKKQRMMHEFLRATSEITREKGIEAVSMRSVADWVGYSRASLYNYFEDLEQLLAFASIDLITEWILEVIKIINSEQDPIDKYIQLWNTYVAHSLQSPRSFAYIYDDVNMEKISDYLDDYCEAFPDITSTWPEEMTDRKKLLAVMKQENHVLDLCIKDGYFAESDFDEIYHFTLLLSNGILWSVEHYVDRYSPEQYQDWFITYLIQFIKSKLLKDIDFSRYEK